ncbi:MAG: hypothetical protein PHC29_03550 [Candidatus Omnitrophica bacterium]|nr:hypothetical protein [Candidatus Omnitrophota bacterium]
MFIYEDILREFQKHKIQYIVIGGIAVNLHGALRSTADLDIMLEMSEDNLKNCLIILKRNNYRSKQPIDWIQIADKKTREYLIRKKNLKAVNFYKNSSFEEVDIIIEAPFTFGEARNDIIWVRSGSIRIPLLSIDGLIKMKKKAGRIVDKLDIDALKRIKRLRVNA